MSVASPESGHPAHAPPASGVPYRYYAFGMTIHSDLELPDLQPFDSELPDLTFRRAPLSRSLPEAPQSMFEFGAAESYLGFGGIVQFSIPNPGLVIFESAPGADANFYSLGLLGSVMATVLHRRGLLTMHASGIGISGRGAVFMGDKGAGKSTTAASFIAAGHRLLTDDVLPIDLADGPSFKILPGFPQLKLSEAASRVIALQDATTIPIADIGFNKSRLRLSGSFSPQPVAPAVFYALAPGEILEATPLEGTAAMTALMANAYHARFGAQMFHGQAAAVLMRQCAALARAVPVRVLKVPRDLDRLPDLVRFVERDMAMT
jgi:hypothetical protein